MRAATIRVLVSGLKPLTKRVWTTLDAPQIREIRRARDRAAKVPVALAAELARVTSAAQGKWAEARAADDFAAFKPVLEEVVKLRREESSALADGKDLYDALLDDYEPGITGRRHPDTF